MKGAMQRQAEEVTLLDLAEELEDALHAGQIPAAQRMARQLVNGLSMYAQERQLVRAIERNGLDAPSVVRSLDEYRKRRTAGSTA